ncbi:MAG: primosomal protein N' [Acidobacteria bacterium]|nr:primosomal protein N' [Acidobacteriota bacterium]MCW5969055.1 primosomal protein N' [Blastocatellales bacterium]
MYAEVAIPVHVHQTFTYALPDNLAAEAQPGARVLVTFNKQLLTGYIVALHATLAEAGLAEDEYEVKVVAELFDAEPPVTPELLELTRWIAEYYFAPWGEAIKACLPAGINSEAETFASITEAGRACLRDASPRALLSSKMQALALIAEHPAINARELAREWSRSRATAILRELERAGAVTISRKLQSAAVRTKRRQAVKLLRKTPIGNERAPNAQQQRVIDILAAAAEPMLVTELADSADVASSVIRTLERRGVVEIFAQDVRRDPLAHLPDERAEEFTLTGKQSAALDSITSQIEAGSYAAFLLHGLTGSGKTEVYMRAMRETLRRGKTALMMVPEISLTPMFARRLKAHFGSAIAILHSSLSDGERLDEWNRIRRGEARVCIGARSAVFAPLSDLGLIVVDEEHEASYKQEESPRYHARDTAIVRAARAGAVIVLGSATPSMESYHNAQTGKFRYLKLDERIGGRALAEVQMVDMREVFARHGKQQIFSDEMREAIAENFARGEQTMVLLNRRGFSSYVLCRSCGHTSRCPHCDVALTFHKIEARIICHYCAHQERVPRACPQCAGPYLYFVGEGTEQIETLLRDSFTGMRIARLDRDTTRRRGAFEHLLGAFAAGELDLLVGTQMIAKGHDFPNVTLVCVISVDAGLAIPDFRSAERTFQLLTQVAGRAGRGDRAGRVLIQSYHTEHYALELARAQVYEEFYKREIHFRREMHYPPFVSLINLIVRHREYNRAAEMAAELAARLRAFDRSGAVRVLGPAPAPLGRLKGEHRLQILVKTRQRKRAREALDSALSAMRESGVDLRQIAVEVDPVSLM